MTVAQDVIDLFRSMEDRRRPMESLWRSVDSVVPPFTRNSVMGRAAPQSIAVNTPANRRVESARKRYDTTMTLAASRLATGILSLVAPENEKWHGLNTNTVDEMADDEEMRWAERVRDVLFFNRYAPHARFQPTIQFAMSSVVHYGPGYIYVDPSFSPKTSMRYKAIPVDEGYILKDDFGAVVGFAQRTMVQARKAVLRGWDVSLKVKSDAEDPKRTTNEHEFIKLVMGREEPGMRRLRTNRNSPWASYTVEVAERRLVEEDGFETFPVACFFWDDILGDYGTSPCIDYLLEQRMLNGMERDVLIALKQIVRPPLGAHDDSLMNRADLNPGAVNPGAVSADGKPLLVPLLQGQNPERAVPFLEQRREHLRDGLYNTLFQALVNNPGQTATEVLTRANEKSQLLAPIGGRMHAGLDIMVERELEALTIRGLYAPNSPLLPPESMEGQDVRPKYTNPMTRLQMAGQAEGTMRMMEIDNVRVQGGRPALIRDVEAGKFLAEAFNTPMRLIRSQEEIDEEQRQKQEAETERQAVQSVKDIAAASRDALPAMEASGLVQPQ